MIMELIKGFICSFLGTLGFAILFNVPKRFYIASGLTGSIGWLVDALIVRETGLSAAVAAFFGAMVVVLISRVLTVVMECPITLFIASGIIPLVPGAGIYETAYDLVTEQLRQAASVGFDALTIVFGIVLGIIVIVSLPRQIFRPDYWWQLRYFGRRAKNE